MKTSLAIDIGNTRTKLAVFEGDELVEKAVWEKLSVAQLKELAYNQNAGNVILSSVADVPEEVEAFLKNNFYYLQLTTETPLPITIHYKTPHTLGKDRIAAAAGAFHLYPGENCLVIDAGTCITYDLLDAKGSFQGGNIAPGIDMRLKAMHHFTARLPLAEKKNWPVQSDNHFPFLGYTTENALLNGGVMGAVMEMNAFIEICRKEFSPLHVILTGGDADFFVKTLKTRIFAHPNLVLTGLHKILKHNVQIQQGN